MKTIDQLLSGKPEDIIKNVIAFGSSTKFTELADQYNPSGHSIFDITKRPDKKVKKMVEGKLIDKNIPVTRISLPLQKLIVGRAVAFLLTNPIQISLTDQNAPENAKTLLKMILYLLKKNKMTSVNKEIARILFKETEVAEYWYPVEEPNFWKKFNFTNASKSRLRCRLFYPSNGDKLYPIFDQYQDMIAFGRGYKVNIEGTNIEHLDLFTDSLIITFKKEQSGWTEISRAVNMINKIPVVYYKQEQTEWSDVQTIIERLETLTSNFSDTNDYFGSPMVKVKGAVKGFADKGDSGKVIEVSDMGDADYLTWDQSPESTKLEIETLLNFIYSMTQTPDISFKAIQGIGDISGIALQLMFLDAFFKAENKKEIFSDTMERRLSVLKAFCMKFNVKLAKDFEDVDFDIQITPYIPQSSNEMIDMLFTANGGKAMISRKSSIAKTGFITDVDSELEQIKAEEKEDSAQSIAETFIE